MLEEVSSDRSGSMLEAVSFAVKRFSLASTWETAVPEVLSHLGESTEASRVYLFRNLRRPNGELCMDEIVEWLAPGIEGTMDDPENHGWPYSDRLGRYVDVLGQGGVIHGRTEEFPEFERPDLEEEGILSTAFVPVFVADEWWGYMGYDDCATARDWSDVEIAVLRTAAETLGAAIQRQGLQDQLMDAQERFRLLVEQTPAVLYADEPGEEMETSYIGPQIQSMLGITQSEWCRSPDVWERNLHPEDRLGILAEWRTALKQGGEFSQEYRMVRPDDGRVVWIRDDSTFILDEQGQAVRIQGVMYDITSQKLAEEKLAEAQQQFKILVEEIPAITYLDPVDEDAESIYVSPQVESILGLSPEEWIGDPSIWRSMLHPDDADRVWDEYTTHRETGEPLSHEYRMVRSDGRVVWVREDATILRNEEGEPFLIQGLIYDITDRKAAEEQIAFLAYHDALTKLANRAMFEEMLEPAMARARRSDLAVAVLFMDLDNFKDVNDTLGHDAGDQLLVEVAHRLVEATRETDLVARQGGDEFLVLISDLEPGDEEEVQQGRDNALRVAELLAERIHRGMRAPFMVADTEVHASMSIGISVFPVDAVDARSLMKNADAAMYDSKKARPGGYSIHAQTSPDPLTSLTFTRRLRKAVKNQAWVLHYQPFVELATGRMTGVEALVRWRRTSGGLIPPSEFLPIAEEMGLLEIIGEWVFEELCRQRNSWAAAGMDLNVSFNLSPRQLWQRDLSDKLAAGLRDAQIEPDRVIIEIAESTAMTDPSRTQRILWSLHEQGFRIAIDDFGTGYTPPARIKHLPVDILKIDQPLIRDLPEDGDVGSFVKAVIDFANDLGTVSHAEGIETQDQWRFLREQGCMLGQGYLFSRPLPAEGITELWKQADGLITP